MAGNIDIHPAPGVANGRTLPPGFLIVPNTADGMAAYGISRAKGIGEILATAGFSVPQNPVTRFVSGSSTLIGQQPGGGGGLSGCGCGCGGKCGCGGGGLSGISEDLSKVVTDITSGNFTAAAQDPVFGIPAWILAAGFAFFLFGDVGGGSRYIRGRRAYRAASAAY